MNRPCLESDCMITVDGSEIRLSPVGVGSLNPHYLRGFVHPNGGDHRISSINSIIAHLLLVKNVKKQIRLLIGGDDLTCVYHVFLFFFSGSSPRHRKIPPVRCFRCTLQGTNISSKNGDFEDDFPFPKVGYVNSLGVPTKYLLSFGAWDV